MSSSSPSDRVEPRFGVLVLPDAPFPTLFERWARLEELGFDFLFAPDHARHTGDPSIPWFDGLTVVAAMALRTNTIRIGTLVANPILHLPSALAKAAAAVDHLSGGRLELGIGMGVEEFDHQEAGSDYWSAGERGARYSEYVEVVDGVLRSWTRPFSFEGRYYRTTNATLAPSPLQQPRPPLIIGSRSATGRALAAQLGECWNTYALTGEGSVEEIAEKTRRRNNELDQRCADIGRDPRTLRRSLVMWPPLDPWADADGFKRIVETFLHTGINEFVVMWPGEDRRALVEHAAEVMTSLRAAYLAATGPRAWATKRDAAQREASFLRHLAPGASNPAIAQSHFLTVKTIETHLGSTYRKLGIRSRHQLAGVLPDHS